MSADDLLPTEGKAAPPRANGELVFEAPWESRLFGLTMALHEQGHFAWPDFQEQLIAAIAAWEAGAAPDAPYPYYHCWLRALEALLGERGLVAARDLDTRARAFAARPHGHDH